MTNEEFVEKLKLEIKDAWINIKHTTHKDLPFSKDCNYLDKKKYSHLVGLYRVIKYNYFQSCSEIENLIKQNATTFPFLNEYIYSFEYSIETLCREQPFLTALTYMYIMKERDKELNNR